LKTGSRVRRGEKLSHLASIADGNRRRPPRAREKERKRRRKRGARFFPITQSRPLRRTRMSRKVRPLETCVALHDKSPWNKSPRPTFRRAPRPTQPADALTSENRLKGVALDRLHRRLIDASANNNPTDPARTASHGSALPYSSSSCAQAH